MKRIIVALAMVAASVFVASPALADEAATDTVTSQTAADQAAADAAAKAAADQAAADQAAADAAAKAAADQATADAAAKAAADQATADAAAQAAADAAAKAAAEQAAGAPAEGSDDPAGAQKVTIAVVANDDPKHFVCKYVGTPGVNESLQTGNNPISVGTPGLVVGSYFQDSQGRSYVLAEDTGQAEPDVSECPPPQVTLIEVTPGVPSASDATCDADGALIIPTTTGVVYVSTPAGTGPETYTVTATAAAGYVLIGDTGPWTVTVDPQLTGEQCDGGGDNVKVFVCKFVGTPGVDERLQTGQNPISVSVNSILLHNPGPVVVGYEFADAQGRSLVIAFDTGQPEPGVSSCLGAGISDDAVADVVTSQNCDGGDVPHTTVADGVTYKFTKGDGVSGPWEITATAEDGFTLVGQTVFTGNAGDPDNCDVTPAGEETPAAAALPDTGGTPLGLLAISGLLIVAGVMLIGRRRTI